MSDRAFGVEIEFVRGATPKKYLCNAVKSATGTECLDLGYVEKKRKSAWKLVPDDSIDRGFELVSPILRGPEGLKACDKAVKAISNFDVSVSNKCGLHVHVDATDIPFEGLKRICQNWVKYEEGIDLMVADNRRHEEENDYCLNNRENKKLGDLCNKEVIHRIDQAPHIKSLAKAIGVVR